MGGDGQLSAVQGRQQGSRQLAHVHVPLVVGAVNPALLPAQGKSVAGGGLVLFVQGEALFGPIAADPHAFHLGGDALVEPLFPLVAGGPVGGQVGGVLAVGGKLVQNLGVSGQTRVVGAGQPQGVTPLEGLVTGFDVLEGEKHRVAQMELAGDVGWGHGQEPGLGFFGQQKTEAGFRGVKWLLPPCADPMVFGGREIAAGG